MDAENQKKAPAILMADVRFSKVLRAVAVVAVSISSIVSDIRFSQVFEGPQWAGTGYGGPGSRVVGVTGACNPPPSPFGVPPEFPPSLHGLG